MSIVSFGKRLWHIPTLIRSPRPRARALDLDLAERSFRHIWRYLKFSGSAKNRPDRKKPNVLVLQMGKVASLSIHQALNESGLNSFHCHSVSLGRQQDMLTYLLKGDLSFRLTSHELRLHIHCVSLGMLVRWYREHKRYKHHRLKVITLTRDPTSYYKSSLVQRRDAVLPRIAAWHRSLHRGAAEAEVDQAKIVQDFVQELASIIAVVSAEDSEKCMALACERWPDHAVVAQEVEHWLRPLGWFNEEITEIFGLDVLAEPDLRERGWVVLQNDWVEVLALRFEQLNALVPKIAEFAGLQVLNLPQRNVTEKKSGALTLQTAMNAAIATPTGQACVHVLRASAYARACGYDRPIG